MNAYLHGTSATNRFEWVLTQFACARICAILVNINPACKGAELEERESNLQFNDPVNIQYTSGMTGFPKGMTETSRVSTQSSWNDPLDRRVSTVGRVHPHVEVKIVNPESGAIVPLGSPGEPCTRGYCVMIGVMAWVKVRRTRPRARIGAGDGVSARVQ